MQKIFHVFLLAAIVAAGTSCATIVSRSVYPITFDSNPEGAKVTIVNRAGHTVYNGVTPSTVSLESSAGYMKREIYSATFAKEGYDAMTVPVASSLNGWYVGNILLGGWIGWLIVDPASGAMWRFGYTDVHVNMNPDTTAEEFELRIMEFDEAPETPKATKGIELERID